MIQQCYDRGDQMPTMSLTTCEGQKGTRDIVNKDKLGSLVMVLRCTNKKVPNHACNEEIRTVSAVITCLEPDGHPGGRLGQGQGYGDESHRGQEPGPDWDHRQVCSCHDCRDPSIEHHV